MRELSKNEILNIHGGIDNEGYNFSFVIQNTVTGCFLGLLFGLFTPTPTYMALCAGGLFACYASLRMIAKSLDGYFFSTPDEVIIHIE